MTIYDKIKQLDSVIGHYNLTPEQLEKYKELRKKELEATAAVHEYLNSLLDEPLATGEREALHLRFVDAFISNNVGDGMDEDRAEAEMRDMSDWEFVKNFGRLKDLEKEEEEDWRSTGIWRRCS